MQFRDARGNRLVPVELHGRIDLIADAYDKPEETAWRGWTFPISNDASERLGVAPAAIAWSMSGPSGRTVVPRRLVVDFRRGLPPRGVLRVTAIDVRGNRSSLSERVEIRNWSTSS